MCNILEKDGKTAAVRGVDSGGGIDLCYPGIRAACSRRGVR